jgi:membrane glycosyltransferase
MRMRQSLADLEEAFAEEISLERTRRAQMRRSAAARAQQRDLARRHKHGSVRFVMLVLSVIATCVVVTIVMFRVLYILLG